MSPAPQDTAAETLALTIVRRLQDNGYRAYYVGGAVRDMLLGRRASDYDVATDAPLSEIRRLFPEAVPTGEDFGVLAVRRGETACEVATFRSDFAYSDGRRPARIEFTREIRHDAARRDFTINALFYDPIRKELLDFVGGRKDLSSRLVRAIGDPHIRFTEDYLRMLRAVRIAANLNFEIEECTAAAIRQHAHLIKRVSPDRIRRELTRLMIESPGRAGRGFQILHELELLIHLLPEVEMLSGQEQPTRYHPEGDVFTHTVMMLDAMRSADPVLAWSVLLHDIAKPLTARYGSDRDGTPRIRFDEHARRGAEIARDILTRLRFSRREIADISFIIGNHMRFMDVRNMRRSTLLRLVSAPTFPTELELHRLDCLCSHGDLSNYRFLKSFSEGLRGDTRLPSRWINGHDILALGVAPGPRVGELLKKAYEAQLDNRFSDRQALLQWVRELVSQGPGTPGRRENPPDGHRQPPSRKSST